MPSNTLKKKFNFRSFAHAINGIWSLVSTEPNAKVHATFSIITIIGGFLFNIDAYEWIAILICIGLVFSLEAINTAIETLSDLVQPERDASIKYIKDISAGAVLMAALSSLITASIIFIPKIILLW